MPASRTIPALLLLGSLAMPALAADPPHHACLSKTEQRAEVAAQRAIPLAQAIRAAHAHGRHGEVLGARLCRHDNRLAYVLTLLSRNGKVVRATVDAATGEVANEHAQVN